MPIMNQMVFRIRSVMYIWMRMRMRNSILGFMIISVGFRLDIVTDKAIVIWASIQMTRDHRAQHVCHIFWIFEL